MLIYLRFVDFHFLEKVKNTCFSWYSSNRYCERLTVLCHSGYATARGRVAISKTVILRKANLVGLT